MSRARGQAPSQAKTTGRSRWGWFAAAGAVIVAASAVATFQPLCPEPQRRPEVLSPAWWVYPVERNAFRRLPVITADLHGVHAWRVGDAVHVCAVGTGGLIVVSADGGRTWKQAPVTWPGPTAPPAPSTIGHWLAPTVPQRIFTTLIQASPSRAASDPQQNPDSDQADSKGGTSTSGRPGGGISGWDDPVRNAFYAVDFEDDQHGWAVGENGTIAETSDGGERWRIRLTPTTSNLYAVSATLAHLFVGGDAGTLLGIRKDGWYPRRMSQDPVGVRITALDVRERGEVLWGRAVGDHGAAYWLQLSHSKEPAPMVRVSGGLQAPGTAALARDPAAGWAADANGTIYRVEADRSVTVLHEAGARINSLDAFSNTLVIGVGAGGTITTGDEPWTTRGSGATTAELLDVSIADDRTAVAVGRYGTVLRTRDGGATWESLTSRWHEPGDVPDALHERLTQAGGRLADDTVLAGYSPRQYPPPWYYLALVLAGLLLVPGFRERPITYPAKPSVADVLVSDRPLEPGDPDPIQFGAVARGMSRFLRNENTRPPLTLAITGQWGSGKSSLMNLLKADLAGQGVQPVWFNAWHYQQEEHILAALLERVRDEAVPPWWRLDGLGFRWRLLSARWARHWWVATIGLVVLFFLFGYVARDVRRFGRDLAPLATGIGNTIGDVATAIGLIEKTDDKAAPVAAVAAPPGAGAGAGTAAAGEPTTRPAAGPTPTEAVKSGFAWTGVLAALAAVALLIRNLTAFGVRPAALMASVSNSFKIGQVEVQASVRKRFADQFRDVTRALGPRRNMLILVDDLDRCRPDAVLEVLEAINFLVTSGECFVVLGMDPVIVERCIGLGFEKVAEELAYDDETATAAGARQSFLAQPAGAAAARAGRAAGIAGTADVEGAALATGPATVRRGNGDPANPTAPAPPALASRGSGDDETDENAAARAKRQAFARNYLEKLVQIRVPVPRATHQQTCAIVAPPKPDDDAGNTWWRRAGAVARRLVLPATLVTVMVIAFWRGSVYERPRYTRADDLAPVAGDAAAPARAPGAAADGGAPPAATGGPPAPPLPTLRPAPGDLLMPAEPTFGGYGMYWLLAAALAAVGGWLLFTRPEDRATDSEQFTHALRLWHPLTFSGPRSTPRAAKRFLNHIRFLAMRHRPSTPRRTRLQALTDWVREWRGKPSQSTANRDDDGFEERLVGLASIELLFGERFAESDPKREDILRLIDARVQAARAQQNDEWERDLIRLREHVELKWDQLIAAADEYRALSAMVVVR